MVEGAEEVVLLTVRARGDPGFPDEVFVSLRLYAIPGDGEPVRSAEVATIPEAIQLAGAWLEDYAASLR